MDPSDGASAMEVVWTTCRTSLFGRIPRLDSDLEHGPGHARDGTHVSVVTAQLHSHQTIVATGALPEVHTLAQPSKISDGLPVRLFTQAPSRHLYWLFFSAAKVWLQKAFCGPASELWRRLLNNSQRKASPCCLVKSLSWTWGKATQSSHCATRFADEFFSTFSRGTLAGEDLPVNVGQRDFSGRPPDNDHPGRLELLRSSNPGSWGRRRKGLDSMIMLEHRTCQVKVGSDHGLGRWQPSCVSTRPPSPCNTRLVPPIYPFSRIWLQSSMVEVSGRHDTSVSQRHRSAEIFNAFILDASVTSAPSAAAVCRDVTFSRWLPSPELFTNSKWQPTPPLQVLLASLLHIVSLCLTLSHIVLHLPVLDCAHLRWILPVFQSWLAPSDVITLEKFDPQITACYTINQFLNGLRLLTLPYYIINSTK